MNCKFCGDFVDVNDTVCQSCGRSISAPEIHYRNDKLEKNDDLKGYYKDQSKQDKTKIPKLVAVLLLLFAFPLGLIAVVFSDFKHVTKMIILGFGIGVPCLFFLSLNTQVVETTSYTSSESVMINEETMTEIEVVVFDDVSEVVVFDHESEEERMTYQLFNDLTDIDDISKAMTLVEAVGVEGIESINYIGLNTYTLMCQSYQVEIEVTDHELVAIKYNEFDLYNKEDGGFVAHIKEYN